MVRRAAVVGLLLGAGAPGCDEVLGTNDLALCDTSETTKCHPDGKTPMKCSASGVWEAQEACDGECVEDGRCACLAGAVGCTNNTPQTCKSNGSWELESAGPCANQTCNEGKCAGVCAPGKRCSGETPQQCSDAGVWEDLSPCSAGSCSGGECVVECVTGDRRCDSSSNKKQACTPDGTWLDEPNALCVSSTCDPVTVECVGVCAPGKRCRVDGLAAQECDAAGQWQDAQECAYQCLAATAECSDCFVGAQECAGNTPRICNMTGKWQDGSPCEDQTCVGAACIGVCAPGQTQCVGNTLQTCDVVGQWQSESLCLNQTCVGGACVGVCAPGQAQCAGNTPQSCDVDELVGQWKTNPLCLNQTCVGGVCVGVCAPGQAQCAGNTPQSCTAGGQWQDDSPCVNQTCVGAACVGVCAPGQTQCAGNTPQICDGTGQWQNGPACISPAGLCDAGTCVSAPHCAGLAETCGPAADESCCASSVVPGGPYNRSNDPLSPATVSDFRLDRFEITVGRFRAFVEAYPGSKPAVGAGAPPNPANAGNGWDAAWNASLPATRADLIALVKCSASYQTWTDAVGANERLPMSCINWFEAFAFCAWDGGRLPTEAEWNYAAAGGNEQRQYPWGAAMPGANHAVFGCNGDGPAGNCAFTDILKVGSRPAGDGKWGHAALAGSVREWNQDWYSSAYVVPCDDCANVQPSADRVFRGGGWDHSSSNLLSGSRDQGVPSSRNISVGARCARPL